MNEQSVHTLRRALREAGFADPHVWVDPDVLRGGRVPPAQRIRGPRGPRRRSAIAALRPVRLFLGNDVLGVGVK